MTAVQEKINDLLLVMNDLFDNHCTPCDKLPKGATKDKKNPVCDACPIHWKLLQCGDDYAGLSHQRRKEYALRRLRNGND